MAEYYYIFRSPNNGHFNVYNLISSDQILTQELCDKISFTDKCANRTGVDVGHFVNLAGDSKEINVKVISIGFKEIPSIFKHFDVLDGISGNY